jgi:hypothetical protein
MDDKEEPITVSSHVTATETYAAEPEGLSDRADAVAPVDCENCAGIRAAEAGFPVTANPFPAPSQGAIREPGNPYDLWRFGWEWEDEQPF